MKRDSWAALGAAASMVSVLSIMSACGGKDGAPAPVKSQSAGSRDTAAAIRVVTVKVDARPFEDWGDYSADLRGVEDAVLTGGMGGRVRSVDKVGQKVKAGEALCDIESDRYNAMLLQAQAASALAKGELERAKVNVEKGSVGKSFLDKAELDYQSARVGLLQAQRAYEDSRCQAPFAGVLVSSSIEKFQTIPPGAPTVRVAKVDRLEAVVSIPESEGFQYREGQKAEFRQVQDPGKVFAGTLRSIDKAIESRNRTIQARIEIDNKDGSLRPGMIGRTRILKEHYDSAVIIPSQAVLRLQDGTAVMAVQDGVAKKMPVSLGSTRGDSVHVLEGLKPGETLITTGAFQVSDGTPVRN